MNDDVKWHKKPPPHIGWWNTAISCTKRDSHKKVWRWWNGKYWSAPALPNNSMAIVKYAATIKSLTPTEKLYWNNYWPDSAPTHRDGTSR